MTETDQDITNETMQYIDLLLQCESAQLTIQIH